MPHWLSQDTVDRAEKALELTGGHFAAAAKLIDFSYRRFKNLVNGHPRLKNRWGKRGIGRPSGGIDLVIHEHVDIETRGGLDYVKVCALELPREDLQDLVDWLAGIAAAPLQQPKSEAVTHHS